MIKILAGGPTVDVGTPFYAAHKRTLQAQREGLDPVMYRLDILHTDGGNPGGGYEVKGGSHLWREEGLEHMARVRQAFLEKGKREGYDAVFMVDTDLLLGPGTLAKMLLSVAPIVYGVFWTQWPGFSSAQTQVWDRSPYGWQPESQGLARLMRGENTEVSGGGACSLIWTQAVRDGARYWPRIQSLPHEGMWRGEDRTFGLTAEVLGIRQEAVGGLNIIHLYSEAQRGARAVKRALCKLGMD